MNLVADLKQRKLVQWTLAYAAAAFALLQGADIVAHQFDWPIWVERVLIIICCVGFFITLLLAWYHGERGQQKVSSPELLILAVLLGIGGLLLWNFAPRAPSTAVANVAAAQPAHAATAIAGSPINPRSIAVLPFANLSADKDNAYFAEGIQDEILTRLSKIAELKVISRTSTMRYASSPDNLPEIARALGVATILEGSVEKVGNAVRINVQLIKADTDAHLWAEIYDRKLVDVFAIQSEVTSAIANSLKATLTANEQRDVAAKPTSNTAAYEAYLRGLAADRSSNYSTQTTGRAIAAYQEAVRLDPEFAGAWRRLTQVLSLQYLDGVKTPAALAALKQAADTTARLRPNSVDAQLAQGYYRYRGLRDYGGALEAFRQVAEREPNNTEALSAIAFVERRQGDMDGAIAQLVKGEAIDPGNSSLVATRGEILFAVRRYPEALEALERALQLIPGDASVLSQTAQIYQAQGNLASAEAVLATAPSDDAYIQAARLTQAWLSNNAERYTTACKQFTAYVDLHPEALGSAVDVLNCRLQTAYLQHLQGQQAIALSTCRSVIEGVNRSAFPTDDYQALLVRGSAFACLGNKEAAFKDLHQAETIAHGDTQYEAAAGQALAQSQVWLGDTDAAIATLAHSLTMPYGTSVALLRMDPSWQPLRNDSRFKALVAGR